MPELEFFERRGVFIQTGFLTPQQCAALRDLGREGLRTRSAGAAGRSSLIVSDRPSEALDVDGLFRALQERLEERFHVHVPGIQNPLLLGYRAGDLLPAHRDDRDEWSDAALAGARRLSAVVTLSRWSEEPSPISHSGGLLTFYNLDQDPRYRRRSLPLSSPPGTLIVFRSDVLHEVTPVVHGERFSLITWFTGRPQLAPGAR
jgi:SM-20-related protein